MKIATLPVPDKPQVRIGQAVVVSDDLSTCRPIKDGVAFEDVLNAGAFTEVSDRHLEEARPFLQAEALAPLPLTHTFLDGSAYVNHVELVRRARGAEMPERFWTDPLMYQGCAVFLGGWADISGDPDWGIDLEAEVAVITGDVPRGASEDEAAAAIRFVMLLNDISLRNLIPDELSKGFGFVQSKPASHCSPVAVTPGDLRGWDGRKLGGTMCVDLNGAPFGRTRTGEDMTFDFAQLIAHAAKTRDLPAGSVIGSGTISNHDPGGGPGRPVAEGGRGYSCIAEQRTVETILHGAPGTPFLRAGDRVKIWYEDDDGQTPFGEMHQTVAEWGGR